MAFKEIVLNRSGDLMSDSEVIAFESEKKLWQERAKDHPYLSKFKLGVRKGYTNAEVFFKASVIKNEWSARLKVAHENAISGKASTHSKTSRTSSKHTKKLEELGNCLEADDFLNAAVVFEIGSFLIKTWLVQHPFELPGKWPTAGTKPRKEGKVGLSRKEGCKHIEAFLWEIEFFFKDGLIESKTRTQLRNEIKKNKEYYLGSVRKSLKEEAAGEEIDKPLVKTGSKIKFKRFGPGLYRELAFRLNEIFFHCVPHIICDQDMACRALHELGHSFSHVTKFDTIRKELDKIEHSQAKKLIFAEEYSSIIKAIQSPSTNQSNTDDSFSNMVAALKKDSNY